MICFPNAKINLGLHIVSRRSDGYHNLETVFYPIKIKDALEVVPAQNPEQPIFSQSGFTCSGPSSDNLVIKAFSKLSERYKIPPLDIHLLKGIPMGAGLGGGSSDVAHILLLLNEMFSLNMSVDELCSLSVSLGADCPFFLYNKPMLARGIGDELSAIELDLDSYHIVVVKPDIHISTKEAYASVIPKTPVFDLKEIIRKPIVEWRNILKNDFEESIFSNHPHLRKIKEKLYEIGADYASMSGSGSAIYGIFSHDIEINSSDFNGWIIWKDELRIN